MPRFKGVREGVACRRGGGGEREGRKEKQGKGKCIGSYRCMKGEKESGDESSIRKRGEREEEMGEKVMEGRSKG